MTCPSCKSANCGNHAACARRKEANTKLVLGEIKKLAEELEYQRGRPLTDAELIKLTKDYMKALDDQLRKEGHIK